MKMHHLRMAAQSCRVSAERLVPRLWVGTVRFRGEEDVRAGLQVQSLQDVVRFLHESSGLLLAGLVAAQEGDGRARVEHREEPAHDAESLGPERLQQGVADEEDTAGRCAFGALR